MSVTTSHQISRYYDYFRDKEIVFTKANLKSLRIDPRQIYLKCNGGQWPCIINSSSLQQAKVIIGTSSGAYGAITKNKNAPVSLRYSFFDSNNEPIQFFVTCSVGGVEPYQGSSELAMVTLLFSQRPPDDLIVKIGEFIEVNQNFQNRKEERIGINKNSLRELGIPKEESYIFITGVPRKCILKDISFGGACIMLVGIPKFLENKSIDLRLFFSDTNEKIALKGLIKSADFLPGRKDISIVHIEYDVDEIPMSYKFHINSYITSYQKQLIENQLNNQAAQQRVNQAVAAKVAQAVQAAQASQTAAAASQTKIGQNLATAQTAAKTTNATASAPAAAPAKAEESKLETTQKTE